MQWQTSLRVWFQQVSKLNWGHGTEWTRIHRLSPFTTPDLKFRSQSGSQITEAQSRNHTQSTRWRRWYFTRHQGHKDKHHFIHHSIEPALYVTAQNKNSSWKKSHPQLAFVKYHARDTHWSHKKALQESIIFNYRSTTVYILLFKY